MAASSYHTASGATSGRVSGRTTPLSSSGGADDEQDLLEQNPVYQDRVPPSPVVHRRASREWVDFEAGNEFGGPDSATDSEFKPPPLSELVTEIQQTVDAWHRTDYESGAAPAVGQDVAAPGYADYNEQQQRQEQYAPPPLDNAVGDYGAASWQQAQHRTSYGQTDFEYQQQQQQQEPPQEPYYDYSAHAVPAAEQQQYSYDANAGECTIVSRGA